MFFPNERNELFLIKAFRYNELFSHIDKENKDIEGVEFPRCLTKEWESELIKQAKWAEGNNKVTFLLYFNHVFFLVSFYDCMTKIISWSQNWHIIKDRLPASIETKVQDACIEFLNLLELYPNIG